MAGQPLTRRWHRRLAGIGLALCWSMAVGETTLVDTGGFRLTGQLEAGLGLFDTIGTNFGSGRVDVRTGRNTGDADWSEGYLHPGLNAAYPLGAGATLFGGASAVASFTGGEGDASGYTHAGDGRNNVETAYLGWRSAELFAGTLGTDALEASYGRQTFEVGDGFLIKNGSADQFGKGAFWLAPRAAFERAGLLRLSTQSVHADLFYLKSDQDQDDTELGGLNLEYRRADVGGLGLLYFRVLDAGTPTNLGPREGMDVYSVRVSELQPPALPGVSLWGEYVYQGGSGRDARFDASAWYLEAQYQWSERPWSPALSVRWAQFSGDPDPADRRRRDFDPFFYGWTRGWGTWYQGEVTGEYLLFNSNQRNCMVQLRLSPSEALTVGTIYYRFWLDQPHYFGTPVAARHLADEWDLYADWAIREHWSLSAAYGIAFPGSAAVAAFGDNQRFQLFELAVYLHY